MAGQSPTRPLKQAPGRPTRPQVGGAVPSPTARRRTAGTAGIRQRPPARTHRDSTHHRPPAVTCPATRPPAAVRPATRPPARPAAGTDGTRAADVPQWTIRPPVAVAAHRRIRQAGVAWRRDEAPPGHPPARYLATRAMRPAPDHRHGTLPPNPANRHIPLPANLARANRHVPAPGNRRAAQAIPHLPPVHDHPDRPAPNRHAGPRDGPPVGVVDSPGAVRADKPDTEPAVNQESSQDMVPATGLAASAPDRPAVRRSSAANHGSVVDPRRAARQAWHPRPARRHGDRCEARSHPPRAPGLRDMPACQAHRVK